jgi:hypothetical protein
MSFCCEHRPLLIQQSAQPNDDGIVFGTGEFDMMRTAVFCLLCFCLSQTCHAQGPRPQTDDDAVTEAKLVKMPEPPSAYSVRPSNPDPKPISKRQSPKAFLLTSAGVYSAAVLDMRNTRNDMNFCKSQSGYVCNENNPLARPFVALPAPMYYATGLALATGINWLSWRMARSEKFHRVWPLPQMAAMAANGWGYASSTRLKAGN